MARKGDEARVAEAAPGEPTVKTAVLESIEVLFERHGVPSWMRAGLMRRKRWAAGKLVAEADFLGALKGWLSGPVGGGR